MKLKSCCILYSCVFLASVAVAQTQYGIDWASMTNNQTISWSDVETFLPNGAPGSLDTVTIDMAPGLNYLYFTIEDASVDTLVITNNITAITYPLNFYGTNTFRSLFSYRAQDYGWNGHIVSFQTITGVKFILSEFHDYGLYRMRTALSQAQPSWMFTNAVKITYHTAAINMPNPSYPWGVRYDFRYADSVYLARNPNRLALESEYLYNSKDQQTSLWYPEFGAFVIGRADGEPQIWTVEDGAHPVLLIYTTSMDGGMQKVGAGDVDMSDIDVRFWIQRNTGFSDNGRYNSNTAGGRISANSFFVDGSPMAATWIFGIVEHLALNGEAGVDWDGEGTGYAVDVVTGGANGLFLLNNNGESGWLFTGCLEAAPTAFPMRFRADGVGSLEVRIANRSVNANNIALTNSPVIIANTLELASPAVFMTDRCTWDNEDRDLYANSVIEFRGDFVNQSTNNVAFRMDSTTVRVIGGTTNTLAWIEIAGEDVGADDPGIANFAWRDLILGQDSTNGNWTVNAALRDEHWNSQELGVWNSEALYVKNLELYNNSTLDLRGLSLYAYNGGVWTRVKPGPWTDGDGTGTIVNSLITGTMILVR